MFEPKLSVHCMVNGEMIEKVHKHRTKVLTYSQKNTDFDQLNRNIQEAPWQVEGIFTDA